VRLAFFRRPVLAVALAAAIVSLGAAAAQPAGSDKKGTNAGDKKAAVPEAFPSATVIGVYESVADALRKNPDFFLVKRERYKELVDAEKRLQAHLGRPRPLATTPSKCVLKGKVEGGLVLLQAQFEFDTQKPGEVVRLACGLANATGATLDGRTPALLGGRGRVAPAKGRPGDDEAEGFSVWVEKPGDHQLALDLVLAVAAWPTLTQGFVLDLPRAAMTRLELELPGGAGDIHVGGKVLGETLLKQKNNAVAGPLGAIDRLDLSWKPAQAPSASAVLASEGVIEVRVDNLQVKTEAKLSLRVLGGQVRQWSLLVPLKAVVKADSGDEGRILRIDVVDQKQASLRTIHLKEASASPLNITITSTQPAPQPGSARPAPIGPYAVLGAVRQSGSVLVSNTVADWHLEFAPHGDLTRRGASDEELRRDPALVAAFRYGPVGGGGMRERVSGAISWLDLEAQNVRGQIKTRCEHLLHLETVGDGPRWQVQSKITVTPRWADVDRFTVLLPDGCKFNSEGSNPWPERVRAVTSVDAGRRVEFRLTRGLADPTLQPLTVTIEGTYSAAVNTVVSGRASLSLPRPEGTIEQDGTLTVKVPTTLALGSDFETTGGLELQRQTTHELAWRCPRRSSTGPTRVEVSWQPYRPPVSISSLIDLTLTNQEGRVRQELRYHLPEPALAPPRLLLRVPEAAVSSLRVLEGGELKSVTVPGEALEGAQQGAGGTFRLYQLRPAGQTSGRPGDGAVSRQIALKLDYSFPLKLRPAAPFAVPLIAPDTSLPGDIHLRVWSESGGHLPSDPSRGWSEQNIEEVPGRTRLPVMVLRSSRTDLPLTLRAGEAAAAFTVLIDRALVRVDIGEGGEHNYRVSYRLSRLAGRHLDFELPAPVSLTASLDGKRVEYEPIASDRPELKGRLARLRLSPDLVRKPAILELAYSLTPDRTDSTPVSSTLQAPRLLGEAGGISTRWQITTPSAWVVIAPETGPATGRTWGRRGWLLAPQSSLTGAELERWLAGGEPSAAVVEATSGLTPALVLWRDGTPTVRITHVPQQAWLLACSLVLVLLGLMLARLPLNARRGGGMPVWAWMVLSGLVTAGVLGMLLWPTLAGQIAYGCQPGAAVLLLLAGAQWLMHERYRRQLVFLPSFSRSRTGSSLLRQEAARTGHGEPSTIDAPRPVGSSINRR
jgi:hypothetical protein